MMLRSLLLFFIFFISQSWSYASAPTLHYSYDVIECGVADRNIEWKLEKCGYDGVLNRSYYCHSFISSDLQEKTRNGSFFAHIDFSNATNKGAKLGGGGTLDKLSSNEIKRIQNAANRSGKDITVVGSRVNPNKALHSKSDYDFVVNANSKTRNNLSRSLPGAKNVKQGTSGNQDIFKGAVDKSKPHATFKPQK